MLNTYSVFLADWTDINGGLIPVHCAHNDFLGRSLVFDPSVLETKKKAIEEYVKDLWDLLNVQTPEELREVLKSGATLKWRYPEQSRKSLDVGHGELQNLRSLNHLGRRIWESYDTQEVSEHAFEALWKVRVEHYGPIASVEVG